MEELLPKLEPSEEPSEERSTKRPKLEPSYKPSPCILQEYMSALLNHIRSWLMWQGFKAFLQGPIFFLSVIAEPNKNGVPRVKVKVLRTPQEVDDLTKLLPATAIYNELMKAHLKIEKCSSPESLLLSLSKPRDIVRLKIVFNINDPAMGVTHTYWTNQGFALDLQKALKEANSRGAMDELNRLGSLQRRAASV
jgi:hypothetical protein